MSFSSSSQVLPTVSVKPKKLIVSGTRLLAVWSEAIAVVVLLAVIGVLLLPPGLVWADDAVSGSDGSDDTGITVGAWALTVPYIIGKGAFAAGGAVVGGLGYLFSGGNSNTAKTVWTKSIYGTYIIRPEHLRGEEPVHFLGQTDENQAEAAPPAAKPTPESVTPEKK